MCYLLFVFSAGLCFVGFFFVFTCVLFGVCALFFFSSVCCLELVMCCLVFGLYVCGLCFRLFFVDCSCNFQSCDGLFS